MGCFIIGDVLGDQCTRSGEYFSDMAAAKKHQPQTPNAVCLRLGQLLGYLLGVLQVITPIRARCLQSRTRTVTYTIVLNLLSSSMQLCCSHACSNKPGTEVEAVWHLQNHTNVRISGILTDGSPMSRSTSKWIRIRTRCKKFQSCAARGASSHVKHTD